MVLSVEDLVGYYGPTLYPLVQAADLLFSEATMSTNIPSSSETTEPAGGDL